MLLPTTAKGACADFFSQEAFGDKIFVYIERYPSEAKVDREACNFYDFVSKYAEHDLFPQPGYGTW